MDPFSALAQAQSLAQRGDLELALIRAETVFREHPRLVEAATLKGIVLTQLERYPEAVSVLLQAVRLGPNRSEVREALAQALVPLGKLTDAFEQVESALKLEPDRPGARLLQATLLARIGKVGAAEKLGSELALAHPQWPEAEANACSLHAQAGEPEAALDRVIQACDRFQGSLPVLQQRAHLSQYVEAVSNGQMAFFHTAWGKTAVPEPVLRPQPLRPDPSRRLRVAYLSPDFRQHSVASFAKGLIEDLGEAYALPFAYSLGSNSDSTTSEFQRICSGFRRISYRPKDLVQACAEDEIDILVDLAGHTAGSGLPVLTVCRPAPIVLSYLGYPFPTGLPHLDGWIADETIGSANADFEGCEATQVLPGPGWKYEIPKSMPDLQVVAESKPKADIRFGSFNAMAKLGRATVENLWIPILRELKNATLTVKNHALGDQAIAARFAQRFEKHGIAADRLTLLGQDKDSKAHWRRYSEIDIALDTFPYGGVTTTLEAIAMGVPVVSLCGLSPASRSGLSLLSALGFRDWVATDASGYVETALRLAADASLRFELRQSLRSILQASPLCDSTRLRTDLETIYRRLWHACLEEHA